MRPDELAPDGRLRIHPETRAEWRAWLEANHARPDGVWLVSWRSSAGERPRVAYEEQIQEALCYGWVDSVVNTLDDRRAAIWMSPRRKGSPWSRSNKQRVEQLEAQGLMRDPGRRAIDAARADGSWAVLDGAEAGIVPDDLAAALAQAGALPGWDRYTGSVRKSLIAWVAMAKRPTTRADRVARVVDAAARGEIVGPLKPRER